MLSFDLHSNLTEKKKRCCYLHFTEIKLNPQELNDFTKNTVVCEFQSLVSVLLQCLAFDYYDMLSSQIK